MKTRSSKSRKIEIFPKGPKMAILKFFLGNIGQENVFYYILEGNYAFLGYKEEFKKIKK